MERDRKSKSSLLAMALPGPIICAILGMAMFVPAVAALAGPETLSVAEAIDVSLANSPDLAEADSRLEEIRISAGEVRSKFYPDLSFDASYTYIDNPPEMEMDIDLPIPGFEPPVIEFGQRDNFVFQLKLQQILYSRGLSHAYEAIKKQLEAGELSADHARVMVARMAAEAYWGAVIADESLAVRQMSLANARDHLDQAGKRHDLGAAPRLDVVRAEVEVENVRQQVEESRLMREQAMIMLERAMGADPGDVVLADGLRTETGPADAEDALDRALKKRSDLAARERSREAALEQGEAERAAAYPTVMLNAGYSYQRPYYSVDEWDGGMSVGVGVHVPIYDGGEARLGQERSKARANTLSLTRQKEVADLRAEIARQAAAMDAAARRIGISEKNIARAEELAVITRQAYSAGGVTSLEVQDARLAVTNTKLMNLKAYYDYRIARVRLAAAMGDIEEMGR